MSEEVNKHRILAAFYASDGERYRPVMECSCGWSNGFTAVSWEEAGAAFDEHLNPAISAHEAGAGG